MKTKSLPLLIVFTLLLSYSGTAQKNNLLGNWQSSNGTVISFTKQQLGINGVYYNYQLLNNIIRTADEYGDIYDYTYQIKEGLLYLAVPDVGTYVLKRIQGQQAAVNNQGYNNQVYGNRTENVNNTYNSTGYQNTGGGAGVSRVFGTFCSYSSSGYSGSGSYSTTNRVSFDGRGNFVYGSQSSYSGNGDGYSGGSGGEKGTYRVQGRQLILTFSDGSQYAVEIFFVQDSGEITELKYEGTVYAKSLCD